MAEDMVTVPADTLHAMLGVFARISHLAGSPAVQELRKAMPGTGPATVAVVRVSDLPAIRRALLKAVADSTYEAEAKPYREALQALGGEEP